MNTQTETLTLESPESVAIGTARAVGSSAWLGSVVRISVNAAMSEIAHAITTDSDLAHAWSDMDESERVKLVRAMRESIRKSVQHVTDEIENSVRAQLGGAPTSELWGPAGLLAATMRCVIALQESDLPNAKDQT